MRANKEEVDAAGEDYRANERDRSEPGGTGTAVKQEPIKVGRRSGEMTPALVEAGRSIKIATGRMHCF